MVGQRIRNAIAAALCAALLLGCTASGSSPAPAQAARVNAGTPLVGSSPAAGSTVAGPVNELVLRFDPPARLNEVTVTGPEGTQPMMVHAVGESDHYSVPLPGLGAGSYTVNWRATARGQEYRGSFAFTVK